MIIFLISFFLFLFSKDYIKTFKLLMNAIKQHIFEKLNIMVLIFNFIILYLKFISKDFVFLFSKFHYNIKYRLLFLL